VVERVGAWVRAGLARWEDDRVCVERAALERLGAGLEVDPLDPRAEDPGVPDELAEIWRAVALLEPHATRERIASITRMPAWSVEARLTSLVDAGMVELRGESWALLAHPPRQRWSQEEWAAASRAAADALPPHALQRFVRVLQAGHLDVAPAAAREIASMDACRLSPIRV
jgi:hypothetical protein